MKTQITKNVLAFLILLFGLLLWISVDRAINIPQSSTWLIPIIYFSLFFISISLGSIIIKKRLVLYSALVISFIFNLIFTFSFWHLGILIFSSLLAYVAMEKIAKETRNGIILDVFKSIRIGRATLIVAIALSISSQYYFEIKNTNRAGVIPEFKIDKLSSKIIPAIYPDLENMEKENLTVDDFILRASTEKSKNLITEMLGTSKLDEEVADTNQAQTKKITQEDQEQLLKEGRLKISDLANREVLGSEKISDIFSEIISSKINTYFSPSLVKENSSIISWIAALVLFLTIISLGSFLSFVVIYLAVFIFWILRKTGLIKVSKVLMEVEVIE
ncbi:MAG: hypothetical protein WAV31_03890 [Candidatus Moraniibacteriota bacterium]